MSFDVVSFVVSWSRSGLGAGQHGLHDVVVAGAPTQVPFEADADLLLCRVRVLGEEAGSRHHHARGAVAALKTVVLHEGLLHRMEGAVGRCHPLDGGDRAAVGLDREESAALRGLTVDVHRARSA